MFEQSALEYTFPDLQGPLMESVLVVVDKNDAPVAAVAAERIIQLYLLLDETLGPVEKFQAIRAMHENMAKVLCLKSYREANCFIPPQMEKSFGRRLMRTFGWCKNWPSFAKVF
jgi:hypothetical protein